VIRAKNDTRTYCMMLGIDAAFFYFFLSSTLDFGWVHMGYHDIDPAHCRILPQQQTSDQL